MFDGVMMSKEMLAIGYIRLAKFVYRASWSSKDVEHFVYFEIDSRQYFAASFGLRNEAAEKFGIASMVKYGHPNYGKVQWHRDLSIECSTSFVFGRIDRFSRRLWPRIFTPEITGSELAVFVANFIGQYILPIIKRVNDLNGLFEFLIVDAEPHPWL